MNRKSKPLTTSVAHKIARLIGKLDDAKDANELAARIVDRRSTIVRRNREVAQRAAWDKLVADFRAAMAVSGAVKPSLMRSPTIAAWELPIKAFDRCEVSAVHKGRKHVGFWLNVFDRRTGAQTHRSLWIPWSRAESFVAYAEPDPAAASGADLNDTFVGAMNSLIGSALAVKR